MSTSRTRHLLAFVATGALVAVPGVTAAYAQGGDSNDKQTICHATSSDTNPYVVNTPNKNGDVDGHADHTGPVWNPTLKAEHDWWGDIIPAFDYNEDGQTAHFAGLNWDANGQAWFANDCRVPITAAVDKTNDADGDGTFSDDETTDAVGAAVPFTVTVTNTSVVPAVVVGVSDSVSGDPVTFTATPDPVGTTLAAGASTTFTFTVAGYTPADGASTTNTFTVNLAATDDATNTGSASDTSTVRTVLPPPPADVAVVKTGPAEAAPGDDITWTITVSNTGTVPAADVVVTDALPTGTTLVSFSGDGWSHSGDAFSLAGELGVGASSTLTVVATLAADYAEATVSNTAVVTPADETPGDNTSTVVTDVTQPPGGGGGGGGITEPPFTGGGGGTLPRTGTSTWLLLAAGVLLITSGSGLTVAAQPRHR
jgi:uncharacterized repeat protein (TIGR01451 family)